MLSLGCLRAAMNSQAHLWASVQGARKPACIQTVEQPSPRSAAALQPQPDKCRHCPRNPDRGQRPRKRQAVYMQVVSAVNSSIGWIGTVAAGRVNVVAGRCRGSQTVEPMADRESLAFPTKLLMLPTMPELEPGGGAYAEAACTCKRFSARHECARFGAFF